MINKNNIEDPTFLLAKYLLNTNYEDLPEKVIKKTKSCILDSIGCMIGGYFTEAGKISAEIAHDISNNDESTIMGLGHKASCVIASFANAYMCNALDFDDSLPGLYHPGATIIPPAIAVGERVGANGEELITAIVAGYEISIRVGEAIKSAKKRGYSTNLYQIFGSVAVASKLLSLDTEQILNAFGIAGATTPVPSTIKGLPSHPMGCRMTKNRYGTIALNGVLAALMAKNGFTGALDILDGDNGFCKMAAAMECDHDAMISELGKTYKILDVGFKPYPCCRHLHSSIDAVLAIIKENTLSTENIEKIDVCTNVSGDRWTSFQPISEVDGMFCLPYCIAVAAMDITPGMEWHQLKTRNNEKIINLSKKINVINNGKTQKSYSSTVKIVQNGITYKKNVEIMKGDVKNPMTELELNDKFNNLSSLLLKQERIGEINEMINKLEILEDINELTKLLSK